MVGGGRLRLFDNISLGGERREGVSWGTTATITCDEWPGSEGLYYSNARWYEPQTGRFITEDPARDGQAWYVYCYNNPMRYRDPTGLRAMEDVGDGRTYDVQRDTYYDSDGGVSADQTDNTASEYSFGAVGDPYDQWRMQDRRWANTSIGTSTVGEKGCRVDAAAQMVSAITGTEVTPRMMARYVDAQGSLLQSAIKQAISDYSEAGAPAVTADYWQLQLNAAKLGEIKDDSTRTTWVLAQADIGGGIGQHWVVVRDYSVDANGVITYTVVPSSVNDLGTPNNGGADRLYTSGANQNSARSATVVMIETYSVPRR